jgi:hypothetical protein
MSVQSPSAPSRSPFAELAGQPLVGKQRGASAAKPPRMPADERNIDDDDDDIDSPVAGLVESQPPLPPLGILKVSGDPGDGLQQEGSVRGGDTGMKRTVSWADFTSNNAAALTQVVEFERDPGPSSPTSVDSWEGREEQQCVCCSIQ